MGDKFLSKIKFDTIYAEYSTRNYEKSDDKYYDYFRKLMFEKAEEQEGYIIGSCFKFDGYYKERVKPRYYDGEEERPVFTATKRIDMWVVVTGMNEEYLVPKKSVDEDRYVTKTMTVNSEM